jgi:hypothetical protein
VPPNVPQPSVIDSGSPVSRPNVPNVPLAFTAKRSAQLIALGRHNHQADVSLTIDARGIEELVCAPANQARAHVAVWGVEHGFDERANLGARQHNGAVPLQCRHEPIVNPDIDDQVVFRGTHDAVVERFTRDYLRRNAFDVRVGADPGGRVAGADSDRRCARGVRGSHHR